jgi:glycosyltransferase involved in cell wall biosynthesis
MDNSNISVSVIICTYNRARYISQAIKSVVEQDYKNIEIIVLDDASTDETESIVRSINDPRIKYFKNEKNIGIAANRNVGLAKATGKYIAMLDSDDVWLDANKISKQVAFLESDKRYALVGTNMITIDSSDKKIGSVGFYESDPEIHKHILSRNQFVQSSVLFPRQVALDLGGYDTKYILNEDYDLWLRIGKKYLFANIPEYSVGYRVHETSIMRSKKLLAARIHLDIIKKYGKDYPSFFGAVIKAYARIFLAHF